jgi:hypothetical protein
MFKFNSKSKQPDEKVIQNKEDTASGLSNREKVTRALELLNAGLAPFVEREMTAVYGTNWEHKAREGLRSMGNQSPNFNFDTQALLSIINSNWQEIFKKTLGYGNRSIINELRETRNSWAHQRPFDFDDTFRALDSVQRILNAIGSDKEASEIEKLKHETLRQRFEDKSQPNKPAFVPTQADYNQALTKGIALAQAGRKAEAYQQLKALELSQFQEINLLLWLAFTTPFQNEAEKLIATAQQREPNNPSVIQARQWLLTAYQR